MHIVVLICLSVLSCRPHIGDIQLANGYVLSRYENVTKDAYYILDSRMSVIVPSRVEEIGIEGDYIFGRVTDLNVLAMPRASRGYFVIDTRSGEVLFGLSLHEIGQKVGRSANAILVTPAQWSKR